MNSPHQPKPARLGPPGPYMLPIAEEFLGTGAAEGRLPIRFRFLLEDATELHLPVGDFALKQLCKELQALCGGEVWFMTA